MPECICAIEEETGAESWFCPVHLRRYLNQDEIEAEMSEAMKGEMGPGMRFPGDLMGYWAHHEKLEPKYTLPEEQPLLNEMFGAVALFYGNLFRPKRLHLTLRTPRRHNEAMSIVAAPV